MTWLFLERLGVDVLTPESMAGVARDVAQRHQVSVNELRGPQRNRRVAHPRQEAFAMCRASGRFSLTQIGCYFGNRDHTTVLYGVRAYAARQRGEKPMWRRRKP